MLLQANSTTTVANFPHTNNLRQMPSSHHTNSSNNNRLPYKRRPLHNPPSLWPRLNLLRYRLRLRLQQLQQPPQHILPPLVYLHNYSRVFPQLFLS